jgi:peptidoglycan hydrolase-like protein with peptidoglycan-binding domain
VKAIQRGLGQAGFNPGPVDGVFGPQTQAAVLGFQATRGLIPDGEVGPRTAKALGVTLA